MRRLISPLHDSPLCLFNSLTRHTPRRISKYAACSGECFVLSLVYVDRIIQNNHSFVVNSLNVHRLLITSIMLAAKFFDDQYFNNAYYAKVGGVPCGEMNSLEIEFLFMLNFNLFGATDTFQQYFIELCKHTLNSPCDCHSGPPLYTLKPNGLMLEYDLTRRISHQTVLMTPSPDTDVKMDPDGVAPPFDASTGGASAAASSGGAAPAYAYGIDAYAAGAQQQPHRNF